MQHRRFVLLGVGGVAVLVALVTLTSLGRNLTYYLYPTEAVAQRADFPDGTRFRLAGTVVEGSIVERGTEIEFTMTDGGANIDVVLTERPPPLFDEGVPVLIEGAWEGDRFNADLALVRHNEDYEAPTSGGSFPGS